jgi:NitT/TauT family transport system permease protein
MTVSTSKRAGSVQASAIAGLDSLELAQAKDGHRLVRRSWSAIWPKLLAIVIVLVVWELFYLYNFNGDSADHLVKGPVAGIANLWGQVTTAQLWQAV